MKIVIQRSGAPMQDRLDWYAEKLCFGALKTPWVESVSVQFAVLSDPTMLFGQSDNLCRIRAKLVNGCSVATEAVDSDELMAIYHAVDKIKAALIERPSGLVEVDRVTTVFDDSRPAGSL